MPGRKLIKNRRGLTSGQICGEQSSHVASLELGLGGRNILPLLRLTCRRGYDRYDCWEGSLNAQLLGQSSGHCSTHQA